MNVLQICKDLNELNPLVKVMLELALEEIKFQGVNPLVIETYRPQERQNYLYCQSRSVSACMAKGIGSSFAGTYCNPAVNPVTWTLHSIHTKRKAVDIVPQRKENGRMSAIWNSQDTQTKIIIAAMQKYGFEAGANWAASPDSPHFQVKGDFDDLFMKEKNTPFVTKAVQAALNKKINAKPKVDGVWGDKTTAAVNLFRIQNKWSANGKLGATALEKLLC